MKIITQKLIFDLNDQPTPSCHASTIALYQGDFYSAWFGGTNEGADDVVIWLSKKEKDGKLWDVPRIISSSKNIPHWNPVLFSFGGKLFLYYKKGFKIPTWQTFYKIFENDAWSNENELVPGDKSVRGTAKNKPVQLNSNLILAPASIEKEPEISEKLKWHSYIDISSDGVNWQAQELISADVNLIQPAIWETDGGVHAFMRSDAGAIYRSDSVDGGKTWGKAYATALPNNNSGLDAVYAKGNLYVVYNPVSQNWGARTPLVISKSDDNGKTWAKSITLEDSEGEYSYPSVIEDNGFLHIVYTYQRKSVMYANIKL
jgi:predicted neuraminidase